MDKHRPWQRMVSMFRRRRKNSGHPPVNSRRGGLRGVRHTPPAPLTIFRDVYRPHHSQSSPQVNHLNRAINWSSVIFTSATPFGDNLERFRSFTPKCLTDINCHGLLMGQESYDDFSSSCWLEDRLHHFAGMGEDIISENEIEHQNPNNDVASITDDNFSLLSVLNHVPMNRSHPGGRPDDTMRSSASHSSNGMSIQSSSGPGSRRSTISDVTRFYNSMNLPGFSFNGRQPPPYSENATDDPPPSYTDVFISPRLGRERSSSARRASAMLFDSNLW